MLFGMLFGMLFSLLVSSPLPTGRGKSGGRTAACGGLPMIGERLQKDGPFLWRRLTRGDKSKGKRQPCIIGLATLAQNASCQLRGRFESSRLIQQDQRFQWRLALDALRDAGFPIRYAQDR